MPPTRPSTTSTPALYLSNWVDLVGIWKARRLAQTDPAVKGPRLGELHFLGGPASSWATNQIVDWSGFFRDETAGVKYTAIENFESEAWFENGKANAGTLTTTYLEYHGAASPLRCTITRSFAAVPGEPFFVVRYAVTNDTSAAVVINVLDQVHLANVGAGDPSKNVRAWYDAARNALVADMTASGQFFVALGAFAAMDGFQVGDDADAAIASATVGGWRSFDHDGTLRGNTELSAADVDLAFHKRLALAPGATGTVDLYVTVRGDRATAEAAADRARSRTADDWLAENAKSYEAWLSNGGKGRRARFDDAGLNALFDRELIVIKNVQNPALGTFAATTSPFAYGYKNWVRDGSITAIALDACGHHDEARRYWLWMANVQGSDGTWKTTYSSWTGAYLSFVEPEYDSVGAFLYGVCRHYQATSDAAFLAQVWPAVRRAADWILSSLSPVHGLGAADFSIWEEPERGLEHNSYTQAWYVAGLYAAQTLAEIRGDTSLADWYAGGPASIATALQRPSTWSVPGMWNPAGYYNRAIRDDGSVETLVDSSSDALIALGVVDAASPRAASHVATMTRLLTHDDYGLARYPDDTYYYTSRWDPAGDEVGAPEPAWPQMSMWVAAYEAVTGQRARALARLQWFARTAARGYMPHGEAVSNVTKQSVLSSMSEPLTASSFLLATLVYDGRYALPIVPPVYNAGAYLPIRVTAGARDDWGQWGNVPYFVAAPAAPAVPPGSAMTTVKRAFVTNDDVNLYVRVDNAAGSFSGFAEAPKFAVRIYAQDFAGGAGETSALGLDDGSIHRPVCCAIERRSDEDRLRRWVVRRGAWVEDAAPIAGVIPPQWDPATGRLEAVVPIAALASERPAMGGAWGALVIALASQRASDGRWIDDGRIVVHYRLSARDQAWIYGNIDQAQ